MIKVINRLVITAGMKTRGSNKNLIAVEIGDEDQTLGQSRNLGLFSKHLALMYQTVLKHFRSTNSWNPHF